MSSRRDMALLAALARPEGASEHAAIRPAAVGRLLDLAQYHGVLPVVMANLATADTGDLDKARAAVDTAVGFSMLLRHRGQAVSDELARRGVPHVILKGASFADRLYDPPSLRTFTDVDLLVPREAWAEASDALTGMGLVARESAGRKHADAYGEQTFSDPAQPTVSIELHWNLVNSPTVRRRVGVTFEDLRGGTTAQLSPASLLLIAAVHAATSHSFNRLTTLCDARQVVRGCAGAIDADELQDLLDRTGADVAGGTLLVLLSRVYDSSGARELLGGLTLRPHIRRRARRWGRPILLGQSAAAGLARSARREILKRS
jgi:hypothetical protein